MQKKKQKTKTKKNREGKDLGKTCSERQARKEIAYEHVLVFQNARFSTRGRI